MASTSPALSVLPFIGYLLLTTLLLYLGLRAFRYIKSARGTASAASLPKPVSGNAGRGLFSLGRSTAWGWRNWTAALPRVPWARFSGPEAPGKGQSSKNTKNLSVELLPTTGLPPPPSATPTTSNTLMPTAPLVDISGLPTPPLTSTSEFSSFPASPRTPSPPSNNLLGQLSAQLSVKPMHPTPAHYSYPRPPSPHALLATTPPQKHGSHKRSRSLGGVAVRRLSGGTSGLRNTFAADPNFEVEMKELVRGTSREHLLIDFTSSGSSGEEEVEDVSPAASDIGMLPLQNRSHPQPQFVSAYGYAPSTPQVPPVRVDARTVGRMVPLVDLGEQDTSMQDEKSLDDAWRWFGSESSLASSSSSTSTLYAPKNTVFSEASVKSRIENLVDVDVEEGRTELVSVPQTIHVRHMAVDGTHIKDSLHTIHSKAMPLVDINDTISPRDAKLVDLGTDEFEDEHVPVLVPLSASPNLVLAQVSSMFETEAGYSHPLEVEAEAVHVEVKPKSVILQGTLPVDPEASFLFGVEKQDLPPAGESPDFEVTTTPQQVLVDVDVDVEHPSVESAFSKPELDSSSWSWDEADVEDPWNNHLSMSEHTITNPKSDLITFAGDALSSTEDGALDGIVPESLESDVQGMLEMSPGGSLLPTAIEDEDGVPIFDLESGEGYFSKSVEVEMEAANSQTLTTGQVEFEEEETTPKPTPVSVAVELPEVVVLDVEEEEFVYEPLVEADAKTAGSPLEDEEDEVFVYPDPDLHLLPLHLEDAPTTTVQPLTSTFAETLQAHMTMHLLASASASSQAENAVEKHLVVPAPQRLPSSQTPTPPASPPPTFGSHPPQSHTHTHLRVLNPTTSASRNGSRTPSPVSPTPRLAVVLPLLAQEKAREDKENDTPTALSVEQFSESLLATKPLWSIRASDAPALGIPSSGGVLGTSPRMRRSVLADMVSNAIAENVDEDVSRVEEEDEIKESPEENLVSSETIAESDAEPTVAVLEQPAPDHQAPSMKLSTSLPGAFPDFDPTPEVVVVLETPPAVAATAITTRRPGPTPNGAATQFVIPSARTLVRSPLDIALAMQMRPGLGAGADPAWMVRFLMAVFGWMAVAVAGGDF